MKYVVNFSIDGHDFPPPKNWMDIEIVATFDDSIQPQIEIDEFMFTGEACRYILSVINIDPDSSGVAQSRTIFDGIAFDMLIYSDQLSRNIHYEGILDTTTITFINESEISCRLLPFNGLELISTMLQSVTYGLLAKKNIIDKPDYTEVPVVIRKKFDYLEVTLISVTLYIIIKDIRDREDDLRKLINQQYVAIISTPTQKPAEIVKTIVITLIYIAYAAFMLIALYNMVKTLVKNLIPIPVKYKGLTLRTAMTKALSYFQVDFQSDIKELDYYVYLPSKTDNKIRKNRKDEGIPNVDDPGYQCSEMFELATKLFNAKSVVRRVNGKRTLFFIPEKSERLQQPSGYEMVNPLTGNLGVLTERFRLNTDEFKATTLITFQYDPSDEYTMPNERDSDSKQYEKGTSYEVSAELANPNITENRLTKGLLEVRLPLALGSRRNKLSAMEYALKTLLATVDSVITLFGGKTFNEKIDEGRGRLVISQNSFNVPKLVVIQNGMIPENHRDLLSARYLYNEYYTCRSFKQSPYIAQKKIFEDVRIPFGFEDYLKCESNSMFTHNGLECKFRNLKWKISNDTAVATFEVAHKYINPEALNETPIEP